MVGNFLSVNRRRTRLLAYCSVAALSLMLAACGGGDDEPAAASGGGSGGGGSGGSPSGNQAPIISGDPPASAMQGTQYSYTPDASDADGDSLTFTVSGLPSWASFDSASGRITGTPGGGDLGVYADIVISVTDGLVSATLSRFSIDVVATATGTATLSWYPPTQKTDGSALTGLAGYRIYWGTTEGDYSNSVTLDNPGITTYMIEQLTPATWYFATTAFDSLGMESPFSNVASKTVQ
jgi:hypothetical protein